ncbi:MAG: hypothetical protein GY821_13185 [Gammaproteobacteria bacterium]|nr:hypothetical protein [Gammaproteobacteria bacterium]
MLTIFSEKDKKREDKAIDWQQLAKNKRKGEWGKGVSSLESFITIIKHTNGEDHFDLIKSFTTKRLCWLLRNAFSSENIGVQITSLFQATISKGARHLVIQTVAQAIKNSRRLALLLQTIPADLVEEEYLAMAQPIIDALVGSDEKYIRASKAFQLSVAHNNVLPVEIIFMIFTMLPLMQPAGFVKKEDLANLLKAVLINATAPRRQLALRLISCCDDKSQQYFFHHGTFNPFWYQAINDKLISASGSVSSGINYAKRIINLKDLNNMLGACCPGAQKLILGRYCSPLYYNFFATIEVPGCIDSSFNNLMNLLQRYNHEVNEEIVHNIYRYSNGIYRFCKNVKQLCQVISYCNYDGKIDIIHSIVSNRAKIDKFISDNDEFCQLLNAFDKKSQYYFLKILIEKNIRLKNVINNQDDLDKVCQACKGKNEKLLEGLFILAIKRRISPVEFFYINIFSNSNQNSQFVHDIELAQLTAARHSLT